jgi:hypothetical protein
VTDQCHSVVSGPLQARPILIQAQATLISLPWNHTEGENNTHARVDYAHISPLSRCRLKLRGVQQLQGYFPSASFLRTASTSARESRIHRLSYTCRQACILYLSREIKSHTAIFTRKRCRCRFGWHVRKKVRVNTGDQNRTSAKKLDGHNFFEAPVKPRRG